MNRQDLSNTAPSFKVIKKYFSCQKKGNKKIQNIFCKFQAHFWVSQKHKIIFYILCYLVLHAKMYHENNVKQFLSNFCLLWLGLMDMLVMYDIFHIQRAISVPTWSDVKKNTEYWHLWTLCMFCLQSYNRWTQKTWKSHNKSLLWAFYRL